MMKLIRTLFILSLINPAVSANASDSAQTILFYTKLNRSIDNYPTLMENFFQSLSSSCKSDQACIRAVQMERQKFNASFSEKKQKLKAQAVELMTRKYDEKDLQLLIKIYKNPTFSDFNQFSEKELNVLMFKDMHKTQMEIRSRQNKMTKKQ